MLRRKKYPKGNIYLVGDGLSPGCLWTVVGDHGTNKIIVKFFSSETGKTTIFSLSQRVWNYIFTLV